MAGSRRKVGIIAGAVVAVVAVAAFAGWWFLIRGDEPEEASIDAAGESLDEAGDDGATGDDLDGEWTVDTEVGSFDDFSSTWAGYRFDEELANVGANTAVGRTPEVTGTMTVEGEQVTAVDIEVDLTTLESDNDTRDNALGSRGLESNEYPTATFSLTSPVEVPDDVVAGETVTVPATGDLTIRDITNEVTVDIEAELAGGTAAVVGNAPVALADFEIDPPTGFSVVSIADTGTFEFQLFFTKD